MYVCKYIYLLQMGYKAGDGLGRGGGVSYLYCSIYNYTIFSITYVCTCVHILILLSVYRPYFLVLNTDTNI